MGSNKEIRQRMEFYRKILLVLNWIGASIVIIVGFGYFFGALGIAGIIIIIGGILVGVIVHFLINVALAIPFILLNNGDILDSMKNNFAGTGSKTSGGNDSGANLNYVPPTPQINYSDSWVCKKCGDRNPNTASSCKGCGAYK